MTTNNKQRLRLAAVKTQLQALKAQSQVLSNIDLEHGNDKNDSAGACRSYLEQAEQLLRRLHSTIKRLTKVSEAERIELLQEFRQSVRIFKVECTMLIEPRVRQAQVHLDECTQGELSVPASDALGTRDLETQAHLCCYSAETGQIRTFVLQLIAFADLCLEALFTAGATSAR